MIPNTAVNRKLFSFYLKYVKLQYETWNLKRIQFKGFRGANHKLHEFTLAELPVMSPYNCIPSKEEACSEGKRTTKRHPALEGRYKHLYSSSTLKAILSSVETYKANIVVDIKCVFGYDTLVSVSSWLSYKDNVEDLHCTMTSVKTSCQFDTNGEIVKSTCVVSISSVWNFSVHIPIPKWVCPSSES
ncbi:unnamed protein product [Lactuca saligna]|uniref:Uncharacterized protein n=1 Tax=Lactuca saligna TaxID=75948 RepID=A0AA36E2V7_LACSI|nr:unnamed protein product [Lactuca saligna]